MKTVFRAVPYHRIDYSRRERFIAMRASLLEEFLEDRSKILWYEVRRGFQTRLSHSPAGLLSGSFDPLHAGHRTLRTVAEEILGGPVYCELSISNAEKPPLSKDEILKRCLQFGETPAVLTHEARFDRKSLLFPGMVFVVGIDTAIRICDPNFYDSDSAKRDDALELLEKQSCRFLVAGRKIDERFVTVNDLDTKVRFRGLFEEIPEEKYRVDLSSTELRNQ